MRDQHIRIGGHRHIDRRQAEVVHAPAVVQHLIERDMRDLGGRVRGLARDLEKEAVEITQSKLTIRSEP